ncbi:hypothetical protein ACEPAG_3730 [Sanghuangporus baumii]
MNKAETGYKLRKQIGKTLKTCSKVIGTAVSCHSNAARKLNLPPSLVIEDVLSYVLLGQFDLLRDSRYGITKKPWSRDAEREAAMKFFKLERSQEEVKCISVKLCRLYAYTHTIDKHIKTAIAELEGKDTLLVFQLQKRDEKR